MRVAFTRKEELEDWIYPVHAEARQLPFAYGFFDAIVSLDSCHYYGTDDLYLKYFVQFIRSGGKLGIAVPGLMQELGVQHESRSISTNKIGNRR